jgi:hypothetical protein
MSRPAPGIRFDPARRPFGQHQTDTDHSEISILEKIRDGLRNALAANQSRMNPKEVQDTLASIAAYQKQIDEKKR